jgi:hypothetical protein
MNFSKIILTLASIIGIASSSFAQIPNYLPTNGLVGWWPFNGNANDESGNGNNGTVNDAALTTDRFANANKAYSFNGLNSYIIVPDNNSLDLSNQYTLSAWISIPDYTTGPALPNGSGVIDGNRTILGKPKNSGWATGYNLSSGPNGQSTNLLSVAANMVCCPNIGLGSNLEPSTNVWYHFASTYDGSVIKIFINGELDNSLQASFILDNSSEPLYFGKEFTLVGDNWYRWFKGEIDDIAIWNRALTQEEINDLYNSINCSNNLTISPTNNQLQIGSNANFIATTSDPNPNYIWQSDYGQGFQTLNDFGNYSGTNTNTLSISNIQLANHNQPIRVITTSGECVDTSNVGSISILDTCITSINDTTFITVTDTLVINTLITGINPPNNSNTIKVYPNPSNSHITIEYGDFAIMNGYQLRIENSLGQEVFQTSVTQQSDYLNLNSWGGNGLYFVHVVDPQGNTIDIRKIVLQ